MTSRPKRQTQTAEDIKQSQAQEAQRRRDKEIVDSKQDWDKYSPVFITAQEKALLEGYGAQNFEGRADLFGENASKYATLFIKVLTIISQTEKEIHEYVLGLIDQLLQADPSRSRDFHAVADAYTPLMRIIHRDRATDDAKSFVEKACRILSVLLSNDVPEENKFVGEFLNWLISRINPTSQELKERKVTPARATQLLYKAASLKDMLKRPENQVMFIERGGLPGVKAMIELESQNTQLVYLLGFSVWLLTFNKDCVKGIHESQIIQTLTRILRISVREKVIRICFASLKNLLNYGKEGGFEEEMIGLDVPKLAQTCLARNFKDKDIEEDIKVIERKLDRAIEELSSWELYAAEVRGGVLRKGAVHTETFFKENNMKFEGNGFEIVKRLITLLPTSIDEGDEKEEKFNSSYDQKGSDEELAKLRDEGLEMVLFDLGEFARVYPRGKSLIEDFKGKTRIMYCMSHPNPRVKKGALLCVQKMMVQNWEFLNKTGAGKDKAQDKDK